MDEIQVDEVNRVARECGEQLLAASAAYEGHVLPIEEHGNAVVLALVGRSRRLMRAAFLLSDAGLGLEGAAIRRTLIEYVLTLRWLLTDPGRNLLIWQRDDVRVQIAGDKELIEAGEGGQMSDELRARAEEHLAALDRELDSRGITERRIPSAKLLSEPDMALAYAAYRHDSQTGTHPRLAAAEMLLSVDREVGKVTIHGEPVVRDDRVQLDTYGVCAYSLLHVLAMADHVFPDRLVDRETLASIRTRLDGVVGLPERSG